MRRLLPVLIALLAVATNLPVQPAAAAGPRIDVRINTDGPWTAYLIGFDNSQVFSVTYYVRDAKERWRQTPPITAASTEGDIRWWEGDNAGFEVVTAHVKMRNGKSVNDPGGWHWVDGRHANPGGLLAGYLNSDGSLRAEYIPATQASVIKGIEFWLRDGLGHWHDAGPGVLGDDEDSGWALDRLKSSIDASWQQGDQAALSAHVIWPNGSELIDPVSWATSFERSPTAVMPTTTNAGAGSGPVACGDPTAHVYNPSRLRLLAACVSVTGTIDAIRTERDGDLHILLKLDPGQDKYLNAKNVSDERGDLVLEPVCVRPPTQTDATSACTGYTNPVQIPSVGSHVVVSGAWTLDIDHGWQEIHPVAGFGPIAANQPPGNPTPIAVPAPTPPPPAPPTVRQLFVTITASTYGSIAANTLPGSVCSARVRLPSGNYSVAQGLAIQPLAGADGNVSWSYGTTSRTMKGTGTSFVNCTLNGLSVGASAPFQVF